MNGAPQQMSTTEVVAILVGLGLIIAGLVWLEFRS